MNNDFKFQFKLINSSMDLMTESKYEEILSMFLECEDGDYFQLERVNNLLLFRINEYKINKITARLEKAEQFIELENDKLKKEHYEWAYISLVAELEALLKQQEAS